MNDNTANLTTTPVRALMFGCGNMGQALISGWKKADGIDFTVVDPAGPDLEGVDVHASMDSLEGEFGLIIIAVKPQMIADVMSAAKHLVDPAGLVLSIAAGTSVKTLQGILGDKAIVRMMPNMPASVKLGLSGLLANEQCGDVEKSLIEKMASENGEFLWLDSEDKLDRFTAIAGSGPGYVFEIMRLFQTAAMTLGFTEEEARLLSVNTVYGSAGMAAENPKPLEELREAVTSKKGVTLAGLQQLMADDVLAGLLNRTVESAYNRAVELR